MAEAEVAGWDWAAALDCNEQWGKSNVLAGCAVCTVQRQRHVKAHEASLLMQSGWGLHSCCMHALT